MRELLKLCLKGAFVQAGSLFLFIQVSKTSWAAVGKPIFMVGFVMAMAAIFWRAVRSFRYGKLVSLCCLQTSIAVAVLQSFGFLAYPGLAKDVSFGSVEYYKLLGKQAATILVVFSAMVLSLAFVSKVLTKPRHASQPSHSA